MDLKELINWSLRHWYWYVVSLALCGVLGIGYYVIVPRSYKVTASLMLRQRDNRQTGQEEVINMMGFGGGNITSDEVKVLTSNSLIQGVAEQLNLTAVCERRGRISSYMQYPKQDFTIQLPDSFNVVADVDFKVQDGEIKSLKIKGLAEKTEFEHLPFNTPFVTCAGVMKIVRLNEEVTGGKYRIKVRPTMALVQYYREKLIASKASRDSKIIELSMVTRTPVFAIDFINRVLQLYNQQAVEDKNMVAMQADKFLTARLGVLAAELDSTEVAIEDYKRKHRIADMEVSAEAYRSTGDQYRRKVASMDAELDMLDFMRAQISKPENENSVIPSNLGLTDAALQQLVLDYNKLILNRAQLLQTALPDNPAVVKQTEQIKETRTNLLSAIDKSRQSLQRMRDHEQQQQAHYDAQLSGLPQQEKHYQEMLRDREAKEKAYLYLVEQKEANTLLLASGGLPAKIVDQAMANPRPETPKLRNVAIVVLVFGLMLPLLVFFFGVFKREYLGS